MRRYKSDPIGKLIDEMGHDGDLSLLRAAKRHRELTALWQEIPDPVLRRLDLDAEVIENEKVLIIKCPTPLVLNHLRGLRTKVLAHLQPFMEKWELTDLRFRLNNRDC